MPGSDEIPLPSERIVQAEIEVTDAPVLSDDSTTLIIEAPDPADVEVSAPVQIERVERVVAVLKPRLAAAIPALRAGKQRITPVIKRELSRIRLVKSSDEADSRYFSIDRSNGRAVLSGKEFPLSWDASAARADAKLVLDFFGNYEGAFEGDVPALQRDYFTLMAWLYFSPLICDLRSLAHLRDSDVVRYPSFAIIFGKSNCGKTSLVDTLTTSMFGRPHTVDKRGFTTAQLRGLQHAYRRHPVVFDDVGRRAFNQHGKDMIKDELPPSVAEYPGFVLSMNTEPHSFPDEIAKRSMMIYTTTALPAHNEGLRQTLQSEVQQIRGGLTGHLYRRYLADVMARLELDRLSEDWLAVSSSVLAAVLAEAAEGAPPHWCREVTWLDYADKRYDRVRDRVLALLRPSVYAKREGGSPTGWTIDGNNVIVRWEQRDAFGRRAFGLGRPALHPGAHRRSRQRRRPNSPAQEKPGEFPQPTPPTQGTLVEARQVETQEAKDITNSGHETLCTARPRPGHPDAVRLPACHFLGSDPQLWCFCSCGRSGVGGRFQVVGASRQ